MIPAFESGGPNSYFLGFPMLQNRRAVPAWSYAFEQLRPTYVIETGTWTGGFTCCLAIAARNYAAKVVTFDLSADSEAMAAWYDFLDVRRERADCLSEPAIAQIRALIEGAGGPVYVLCDAGNKVKEFRTFAAMIRPGDVIAAHDNAGPEWPWSEIREEDVADVAAQYSLAPWLPEVFHNTGWLVKRRLEIGH